MIVIEWVTLATMLILVLALVLTAVRLVLGPSLADRVVALELIALIAVGIIIVYAVQVDRAAFLDVALVLALTAFMAAVGFARFLERGGSGDNE
ncbi:monovalent cation/H+ antiporter complex subunit F [Aquisalimonas asiatica]|uniref:monovalent cation/H+ antiporter complex subunit F n=1 Tax=Aquisalimonas asiatica TaxID=406100 RepID=UPI000B89669B|nr:monovalent cation/H+ antiporter complex subunit F [Aquisalimonas asiatica]